MASDAIDTGEAAAVLGITRQRLHQLRREHEDFPAPLIERPRALFWSPAAITRWGKKHGYIERED